MAILRDEPLVKVNLSVQVDVCPLEKCVEDHPRLRLPAAARHDMRPILVGGEGAIAVNVGIAKEHHLLAQPLVGEPRARVEKLSRFRPIQHQRHVVSVVLLDDPDESPRPSTAHLVISIEPFHTPSAKHLRSLDDTSVRRLVRRRRPQLGQRRRHRLLRALAPPLQPQKTLISRGDLVEKYGDLGISLTILVCRLLTCDRNVLLRPALDRFLRHEPLLDQHTPLRPYARHLCVRERMAQHAHRVRLVAEHARLVSIVLRRCPSVALLKDRVPHRHRCDGPLDLASQLDLARQCCGKCLALAHQRSAALLIGAPAPPTTKIVACGLCVPMIAIFQAERAAQQLTLPLIAGATNHVRGPARQDGLTHRTGWTRLISIDGTAAEFIPRHRHQLVDEITRFGILCVRNVQRKVASTARAHFNPVAFDAATSRS